MQTPRHFLEILTVFGMTFQGLIEKFPFFVQSILKIRNRACYSSSLKITVRKNQVVENLAF